jgi:hypothetical protein
MLNSFSVAERMSWAATRKTTRIEDMAYCLLGIFGVNMPLIYGEGIKAFLRLQEEIIKISLDHSIFVWNRPHAHHRQLLGTHFLAPSPKFFLLKKTHRKLASVPISRSPIHNIQRRPKHRASRLNY